MKVNPIGIIHTPFQSLENMPIQPKGASEVAGEVILDPMYSDGLADLEGFSHCYLIYFFHRARAVKMSVVPFMDTARRGIFATRSPLRPNHIGLSIVELVGVENNRLIIRGVDMLDNTPLLDIKPYIEAFDNVMSSRSGWFKATENEVAAKRSDSRFG